MSSRYLIVRVAMMMVGKAESPYLGLARACVYALRRELPILDYIFRLQSQQAQSIRSR